MQLRKADRRDLPQVEELLKQADLPALDPHPLLQNLLVAVVEGTVLGAIALDVFARSGLVRALVVAPEQRGQGVGRALFQSLKSRAYELSLREIFVGAPTGGEFFEKLGFESAPPEEIPLSIRQSRLFRDRRADAARVLRLFLA